MGELTVSGLDEAVLLRLSRLAAEHGRTIEAEAAAILDLATKRLRKDVWADLAESRRQTGRLGVMTVDLLREDRETRGSAACD